MTDGPCTFPHHALLPFTQSVLTDLSPDDWRHCADFLTGMLLRKPLATGENDASGWLAERWILGCLATELRLMANEVAPLSVEITPRTFGSDPLEKARATVATLAAQREAAEADRVRRLGDAQLRQARRDAGQ